jgi:hypothetical protein
MRSARRTSTGLIAVVAEGSALLGLTLTLVSAPDYRRLLSMALACAAIAGICSVVLYRRRGWARLSAAIAAALALYVIVDAASRLHVLGVL